MTASGTLSLLRNYRRALLRRLEPHLNPAQAPACLPPALVWEAVRLSLEDEVIPESGDETQADRIADLVQKVDPNAQIPPLEHLASDQSSNPAWCQWGLRQIMTDTPHSSKPSAAAAAAAAADEGVAHFEAARAAMRRIWPQAALETDILVRAIVHVTEDAFRSATLRPTFGAIFVGPAGVQSLPAAFETILHETGHHALYLRNFFEPFVTNSDTLVSHPLRPDPRPVSGALHAAHVLARMAQGLTFWTEQQGKGAPAEVFERRDVALKNLRTTVTVLETHAAWTARGRLYFADLVRWERRLIEQRGRGVAARLKGIGDGQ